MEALGGRAPAHAARRMAARRADEKTKDQFEASKRVLRDPEVARVVCATDAGREGELIFRYIYEAAGCRKPVSRLWISSLTPDAIRKGFDALRAGRRLRCAGRRRAGPQPGRLAGGHEPLARLHARLRRDLSVGRVQTPTLAMLVERELAIRALRPRGLPGSRGHLRPRRGRTATYRAHGSATRPGQRHESRGQAPARGTARSRADRRARASRPGRHRIRRAPRRSACRRRCSTT